MDSIVHYSKVDINTLEITDPKINPKTNSKSSYLNRNGGPFHVQCPPMKFPFGISHWTDSDSGRTKHWVNCLLDSNKESTIQFKKLIEDIENMVITHVYKNSKQFLGKNYSSREVVEALFSSNIKYSKDKDTGEISDKYDPTFKINIPSRDGEFTIKGGVFDKNQNQISLNDINTKGATATIIMQCGGIWSGGGGFGLTWRDAQMQIEPKQDLKTFMIQKDEDNESDSDDVVEKVNELKVEDSDDSDDSDESDEDEKN
tara:strand:+ start:225 stop:998 length:774 start_codon:yes stop_codon:yes gene_type:complete